MHALTRMQSETCRRPSSACTVCVSSEALLSASSVANSFFCVSLSNFDKRSTPLSLWSPWRRSGVGGGTGAALSGEALRALAGTVGMGGGGGGFFALFSHGAPGLGLRESAVEPDRLRELSIWMAPVRKNQPAARRVFGRVCGSCLADASADASAAASASL